MTLLALESSQLSAKDGKQGYFHTHSNLRAINFWALSALQHSINGVAFQPDDAFDVNGKCESGAQNLFWRFCQRLYILHSTDK